MSHGVARFLSLLFALALCGEIIADDHVDLYGDPLPDGATARLGTVHYRGLSGSGRIEFLPDGRTLLGSNRDQLVWVDVPSGRTVRTLDIDTENTRLLAVNADCSLAAVTTRTILEDLNESTNGVAIVETDSGARTDLQVRGETARFGIQSACFTPDGQRLLTGEYQGIIRVWSVETGREERSQPLPDSREIRRIDVSADAIWIAACNYNAAYRWEWQSENTPIPFSEPDERIYTVEFSPDGRTVATGADSQGGMRLFDVESGREIQRLTAPKRYYYPDQVAFTSDGSRLAAPSSNSLIGVHPELPGEIDVWDVESGELLHAFPFQEGLRRVAISPDDHWIAASVYEGTITAWNLESGKSPSEEFFGHLGSFSTLATSPDGTLVASGGNEGWAVLWNVETGRARHVLEHGPGKMVRGVAFSPDGSRLASSALDNTVVIWDVDTGERVSTLYGHGELGGHRVVRFTSDGERLLSFGDDWFLRAFDVRTGKAIIEHPIRPSGLTLKSNIDGSVNTDDDRILFSIPSGHFTPGGESLVLAVGAEVYLIDVETGEELRRHAFGNSDERATLSPDGTRFAVAVSQAESEIRIHDLRTGDVEQTISLPGDSRPRIAFSPDGTMLAAAAGTIHVYNIADGNEIARIEPDVRASFGVMFTADGERLVVTHADTTALIWDWREFLIDGEGE